MAAITIAITKESPSGIPAPEMGANETVQGDGAVPRTATEPDCGLDPYPGTDPTV